MSLVTGIKNFCIIWNKSVNSHFLQNMSGMLTELATNHTGNSITIDLTLQTGTSLPKFKKPRRKVKTYINDKSIPTEKGTLTCHFVFLTMCPQSRWAAHNCSVEQPVLVTKS